MPRIPRQMHFLYDSQWTPSMDTLCLHTILGNSNQAVWMHPNDPMRHATACALAEINRRFGKQLVYDDVKDMIAFLKQRHATFKKVVNLPKSHWDAQKKCCVHARRRVDEVIHGRQAKAYFYKGEPEFRLLELAFGQDVVKDENRNTVTGTDNPHTVINISDGIVIVEEQAPIQVDDSDENEVTSPIMRRRLFDDRQSTNQQNANNNFPMRNAFLPSPRDADFSYFNPGSSSCASSDPFNWGQHYFK